MGTAARPLGVVVLWALGSVALVVICLLSISEEIILGSVVISGVSLVGAVMLLASKRPGGALVVAGIPAMCMGALFVIVAVANMLSIHCLT
jgi:hypothetical protein